MKMFFTNDDNIHIAFNIRKKVFVEEQHIPIHIEIDGSDKYAKNMLLTINNKPIGTGRLIEIDKKMYIGRLAVLKPYRKKGYASNIVNFLLLQAKDMGYKQVFIHAQAYAKNFYEKLGFYPFGDEFLEANIPHINMKIDL